MMPYHIYTNLQAALPVSQLSNAFESRMPQIVWGGIEVRMTMMMGLNMIVKDRANIYPICQSIQSVGFNCFASYIQKRKK